MSKSLYRVTPQDVEGKDFINISKDATTMIGKRLSLGFGFSPTPTLLGKFSCLKIAMDYISSYNYPIQFKEKKKLNKNQINKLNLNKTSIPNFWSIMTHIIWYRIKNDKELLEAMHQSKDVSFTSFYMTKEEFEDSHIDVRVYNDQHMCKYLSIIKDIHTCISKTDTLNDETLKGIDEDIKELMLKHKFVRSKKILDGLPFDIDLSNINFNIKGIHITEV